ncbi:phenylalanyl-tRNA synthetase [Myriangium duriaei CBS 260.36]|uniref:Phenylalanine--tRNA ligase, mitochondrial n=1 Tax=Myriangium duriaei CBS 260.36 TaxID=1168546 RepID=A0A9P4J4T4_9PEZI|nr:phenylalanyl-tRNA synthetase [Myriangium duriaei CBS 260.36]
MLLTRTCRLSGLGQYGRSSIGGDFALRIRGVRNNSSKNDPSSLVVDGKTYQTDSWTNVPHSILSSVSRRLHLQKDHPISITRNLIESRFPGYKHHNDLFPAVTIGQNFDSLGFPADHVGRNKTDTYYINKDTVLRTHTSAHQVDTFRTNQSDGFTISADVYRRDAVDRSHYPIFHQMEGAMTWDRNDLKPGQTLAHKVWEDVEKIPKHDLIVEDPNPTTHPDRNPLQNSHNQDEVEAIAAHLKRSIENVVVEIFSQAKAAASEADQANSSTPASTEPLKVRWVEAYFPFTSPSWELEVFWQGDWLEVLGSGVIQQPLLDAADVPNRSGWAFGMGLERIAMLLYEIPDIRLFWSKDPRFLSQFDQSQPVRRFAPFSKYPAAPRDVAFWLPKPDEQAKTVPDTAAGSSSAPSAAGGFAKDFGAAEAGAVQFHENDIMEVVRNIGGDNVEDVRLVDEFVHPRTGKKSLCYRIVYRSLEKTLTGEETNAMHEAVSQELVRRFNVELR